MDSKKSWGIIGGGFMGMTLANHLSKRGYDVTIFESEPSLGGLASAWEMDGVMWDRFYHVILMSDAHTRRIIQEIGLENEFQWVETKTGFYSGGKLYSMSNLIEFFKFPPINLVDKFRLGMTIFLASKINNWRKLEEITVAQWLKKWSGKRVFQKIWLPLLKAKLGDNYNQTSAAFIWATIQRMYAARKSGLKKEMFGYVKGGYQRIIQAFNTHLVKNGVKVRVECTVESIKHKNGKISIRSQDETELIFDYVVSTLPSKPSVTLIEGLSELERKQHQSIKYLGVVCPSVLLNKAISPYYVTNITDHDTPFTGIIEMTALIDPNEVNNKHLVYLPKYVQPDDPIFEWDDEKLKEHFLSALFKMYPELSTRNVEFWGVSKARVVFALPTLGYSAKLPSTSTSIPGYYIINSAQIVNGTLNVNETIQIAESKLKEILSDEES